MKEIRIRSRVYFEELLSHFFYTLYVPQETVVSLRFHTAGDYTATWAAKIHQVCMCQGESSSRTRSSTRSASRTHHYVAKLWFVLLILSSL